MQLRPESLARYIAVSAWRSTSSGLAAIESIDDTPIEAVTNTSPWLSAIGSRNTASRRSARADAEASDLVVGSSTTYSSPDSRATIASGGAALTSRSATMRSTSSPAEWPSESLMFLNRSRSTKYSVGSRSARHDSWT